MDRKQLKHWKERQRAWVEDARYLRFKASRLDNPELVIHGLMTETALNLMAANRAMDALILAMSPMTRAGASSAPIHLYLMLNPDRKIPEFRMR